MRKTIWASLLLAPLMLPGQASAAQEAESGWFVRAGATQLTLADEIDLAVGGTVVPNAGIDTKVHYTSTIQVGRFVASNFAVVLTVGIPPHIEVNGRDALQPFGRLAETTYGPGTLTLQYHPLRRGPFQPYVGAGAAYMHIFSTKDGAFQNVEVDDDLAPALEAGTDIMLAPRYGLFIDVKKAFLRTHARGTFGGAPVTADIRMDPWAVSVGAVVRF